MKTLENTSNNETDDIKLQDSESLNTADDNTVSDILIDDDDDEPLPDWIEMVDVDDDADISDSDDDDAELDVIAPLEQKPKKKGKLKKALFIVGGTLLTFVLVLAATLIIMRITGKSSLYDKASSSGPNLIRDENSSYSSNGELDIDIDNMGDIINVDTPSQSGSSGENSTGNNTSGNQSGNNSSGASSIIPATDADADYDVIYNGVKYAYNDDMITLLVLGIDKTVPVAPAENGLDGGQSDSIFLVIMNPHTMVMDIIAIPRDTITKLWIYDEQGNFVQTGNAQICLQHGYGDGMKLSNERALKAVSYLMYDIPIHSVTSINMGAVGMLNDAVGGVTLDPLETFDYAGFSYVKGQTVTLKGNMAYEYVHYRDCTRHNTASERLARQKQYISLFIEKALSAVKEDLGTVTDVYNIILNYLVTDLSLDEIVYLASEAISYDFGEFISLEGTLDTSMRYERYYLDEDKLQQLIIDKFYEKVE